MDNLFALIFESSGGAGEAALAAILGVIGTFITQVLKKLADTSGKMALVLTVAVSGVLGFVAAWSVGSWDTSNVISSASIVFSLATIAYRFLIAKDDGVITTTNP